MAVKVVQGKPEVNPETAKYDVTVNVTDGTNAIGGATVRW